MSAVRTPRAQHVHRPPVRLTPRGWTLLGSALIAAITAYSLGWPALLAVAGFTAGLVLVGAGAVLLSPVRLSVDRRVLPDTAQPGVPVDVQLRVRGSAAPTEWHDLLPADLTVVGAASGVLPALHGTDGADLSYAIAAVRRGTLPIGPLQIDRVDPLGVAVARRGTGAAGSLTVLPTIHPVRPPVLPARADLDPADSSALGAVGDQRDTIAREYRPGDALRTVDWRSTAHRGELMVRSEAAVVATSIAVAFDLRESVWETGAGFEWAVECVASLLAAADEREGSVRLIVAGSAAPVHEAAEAVRALATVERRTGLHDLKALVRSAVAVDVQVLHVVTGSGAARELPDLPRLVAGATGVVSVVGRSDGLAAPRGWRAVALDPGRPVEEAWGGHG